MGIELSYDKELSGEKGFVKFYSDAKGKRLENMADDYKPPVDGDNLKLTIDSKIQTVVERELDNAEATYNPDGLIAIAMDPNTGKYWRCRAGRPLTQLIFKMYHQKCIIAIYQFGVYMNRVRLLRSSPLLQR